MGVELIKTNIKENILQGESNAISTQIYNNANHINRGNNTINTLGENNANRSHGELNQIYMQEENYSSEHSSSFENDASRDAQNICNFCRNNIKTKNKNIQCNSCFSYFHTRCYKTHIAIFV